MTAREIMELINSDMEHEAFGLRADRKGIEIGDAFDNSHQWYQDWQDGWGEFPRDDYNADPDHPYNENMGCWDDGELDGVCTIGIVRPTEKAIDKALKAIRGYVDDCHTEIYLVGGSWAQGGNDIGESIIMDAVRIA